MQRVWLFLLPFLLEFEFDTKRGLDYGVYHSVF